MSRLNELRYSPLKDCVLLADGDIPMTEYELRALVLNLLEEVADLQQRVEELQSDSWRHPRRDP